MGRSKPSYGGRTGVAPGEISQGALSVSLERRVLPVLLIAPCVAILLAISIFPLIYSLRISLYDWQLTSLAGPSFAGLSNYAAVFTDSRFWNALVNTGAFMVFGIGLEFLIGFAIALLIFRLGRARAILSTLIVIPMIIAPAVVGFQWRLLFHKEYGPVNFFLQKLLGIAGPSWTGDPRFALAALIFVDIWEWAPFMILLLLAGLQSLPIEVFEAARVDGSSAWQVLRNITVPLLKRVIAIALILRLIDVFKVFDLVYLLTGGGPGSKTETLAWYVYVEGFRYFNIGYAAALCFILLIIVIVLSKVVLGYLQRPVKVSVDIAGAAE